MKYSLQMRLPRVEPGAQAWEACMIPLHYMRMKHNFFRRRLLACSDSTEDSTSDVSNTAWSDPMHTRCPAAILQCMSIIIP